MCGSREPVLPVLKAVCSRQDPAGVDEDSSTSVKELSAASLVNINGRLPRLLGDVALFASINAVRQPHRVV